MHYWPDNLSGARAVRATLSRIIAPPHWFCLGKSRYEPFFRIAPISFCSSFVHRDEISFPPGIVSSHSEFRRDFSSRRLSKTTKLHAGRSERDTATCLVCSEFNFGCWEPREICLGRVTCSAGLRRCSQKFANRLA